MALGFPSPPCRYSGMAVRLPCECRTVRNKMEQMYTNVLKLQITDNYTWNPPQQVTHVSMNYL